MSTAIPPIQKSTIIKATPDKVWKVLTDPDLIRQWISNEEIQILTTWEPGRPVCLKGKLHGMDFENTGEVVAVEKEKVLHYTHKSSLSNLPDEPEHYCHLIFTLTFENDQTTLDLTISNFPTETIYKHLEFYWRVTLKIIRFTVLEQEGFPSRQTH